METLDKNLLIMFALDLDLPNLLQLCRTSKRFNELICNNDTFWRHKLVQIGIKNVDEIPNAKEAYKQAMNGKLLWIAARDGDIYRVKYLIENGYNIHARDDLALRLASGEGRLEIVKYLVDHKANIHADDERVLLYASQNGNLEVVKYLVEHGININARDDIALEGSLMRGETEVVKYLISKGARIDLMSEITLKFASEHYPELREYLKTLF